MCWFYDGNTQRLTESGFMEKPGIKPATPGLQDIGLSPTQQTFCGFPWYKPVPPGWLKFMLGTPKGSLNVVLWSARNRTFDPWFTRHSAYRLHHSCFSIACPLHRLNPLQVDGKIYKKVMFLIVLTIIPFYNFIYDLKIKRKL